MSIIINTITNTIIKIKKKIKEGKLKAYTHLVPSGILLTSLVIISLVTIIMNQSSIANLLVGAAEPKSIKMGTFLPISSTPAPTLTPSPTITPILSPTPIPSPSPTNPPFTPTPTPCTAQSLGCRENSSGCTVCTNLLSSCKTTQSTQCSSCGGFAHVHY